MNIDPQILSRAAGCLLGQLAGDSLGSLVEFESPEEIRRQYPAGVRVLSDGGTWDTLAGQPTDDSELALMLARVLVKERRYDPDSVRRAYEYWLDSHPFDCGQTTRAGLRGRPNPASQANGALMRISPLGIYCWHCDRAIAAEYARQDAALTHPHPICLQANALYGMAIAEAVARAHSPQSLYEHIRDWATEMNIERPLIDAIGDAAHSAPADYMSQQGWVVIAFQNALWQLLHAPSLEAGVVDTVGRGGDTDTNAAIAGALLGAVYGRDALPQQWVEKILACRPKAGEAHVRHPRPECFWPVDAIDLASRLVRAGAPELG